MKNDLPISPNKKFNYSISFEAWDEESLEVGQTDNRGYEVEETTDEIGEILYEANTTYGIYMPFAFGRWESTYPDEDTDFYEKGIRKFYTLHITNEDGTEISQEENDFITFLLSDGQYEVNKFRDYAVGGIVLGSIVLGIGALITYFYFKDGKKPSKAQQVEHNGRKYPTKGAWKREHSLENKKEDFEVPQGDRKPLKYEMGGDLSVSKEDYFLVVQNWVYFTFNYPMGFIKDAFDSKHIQDKFSESYERFGSIGALMNFWGNLDGDNRKKLSLWIKNNYFNGDKSKLQSISDDDYANIITHWNMFCFNFPYRFVPQVFVENPTHFEQKWNTEYEKAGATGAVNKFFTELSRDNQRLLTNWVYENYKGSKFEEGGETSWWSNFLHKLKTFDPNKPTQKSESNQDSNGFRAYDLIEFKINGLPYFGNYIETMSNGKILATANGRSFIIDKEDIAKKYAGGGDVNDIDMEGIEKSAKFYTDETRWTVPPTVEKFEAEIKEYQDLKKQLDNKEITPSKIIGKGHKSQYARGLAYKWIKERILIAEKAIEILQSRYAGGGRVTTNDGIIEAFLTSNRELKVGNLATHFNEHDDEILLRNYGTLIATRKGNDVQITNTKYSKTTSTITNKLKNMAMNKGMNVNHTDKFSDGGQADSKAERFAKKIMKEYQNGVKVTIHNDFGDSADFSVSAPFEYSLTKELAKEINKEYFNGEGSITGSGNEYVIETTGFDLDKFADGGKVDKELIDSSAKSIYDKHGMMELRNTFLKTAKTDEMSGDKETADYRRKVVSEYQSKQPKIMKKGGEAGDLEYSDILNVLETKINDAVDEVPNKYENASQFTGEEVEHEYRDGFIPYTDGGYEARWFEYLSSYYSSGNSLPTKQLDTEKERQINYNLESAKESFVEDYPEIVEELGIENVDYNSLYEAGYEDEAEELSNNEMSMFDEDTIMVRIMAHYYNPKNDKSFEGKHTIRLFGDVNMESPYHRQGNLDDSYEVEFTFDSIAELEQKMDEGIEKVISWFKGDMYNESNTEMKVRRMAKGGEAGEDSKADGIKKEMYKAFESYLSNKSSDEQLVSKLKRILGKRRWFRYFKGDGLVSTFNSVKRALSERVNRESEKENMQIALDTKGLQIYDYYGDEMFAKGGYVSKGELVWKKLSSSEKMDFLSENFTPQITPRSQEVLVGKSYNFLPKNVKITLESKYANVEEYAEGGEFDDEEDERYSYPDFYKSQGGIKFKTIEEAEKFIKGTKPFVRKQLKLGNAVVVFNGQEYYIAEKIKVNNEYAEGGEVEDWMEEALESLIEETGNETLDITMVSNGGNEFYASNENEEYRVFKSEDDAFVTAENEVREDMEESPENFNKDFIRNYIDGRDYFQDALMEMNSSYADDIQNESDDKYSNRLISEMVDFGLIDEDDAESDNAEELAEEHKDDFITLMTEEQLNEGNDGLDYFINNFGEEETLRMVMDNNLIDIYRASKDAVQIDGVAHFLSHYDGETLYLSNGYVAFRNN